MIRLLHDVLLEAVELLLQKGVKMLTDKKKRKGRRGEEHCGGLVMWTQVKVTIIPQWKSTL